MSVADFAEGNGMTLGKLLKLSSLAISLYYIILAIKSGDTKSILLIACYLPIPLGCIWFGEIFGTGTDFLRLYLGAETPGLIVKLIGWVLLFLPMAAPMIASLLWPIR